MYVCRKAKNIIFTKVEPANLLKNKRIYGVIVWESTIWDNSTAILHLHKKLYVAVIIFKHNFVNLTAG